MIRRLEIIGEATKSVRVHATNCHVVNKIKGKPDQLHLVHYNTHWYGQSRLQEDIHFLLAQSALDYVGVSCFYSSMEAARFSIKKFEQL